MSDNEQQDKLKINIREEVANGRYSNLAIINHGSDEFVLDFVFVQPGNPQAEVVSRVLLSPGHAKRFLQALGNNIEKYESRFGPIQSTSPAILPNDEEIN